ncbi:hypothetical protein C8R43DRAFT_1138130 [Mycena crocata]|nr:hypothetical protein C8R43DRAFT_1138130 [Mycena crocata]
MAKFDVSECLHQHLEEQDTLGACEEEETIIPFDSIPNVSTTAPPTPPASTLPPPAPLSAALSVKERNKLKSWRRHDKGCNTVHAASNNPLLKGISRKRLEEAKASVLEVDFDAPDLPHSGPTWLSSRSAGDEPFKSSDAPTPHDLSTGLGNVLYIQAEVDAYINWLSSLTILILDSHCM